jgi:hypothetical protein
MSTKLKFMKQAIVILIVAAAVLPILALSAGSIVKRDAISYWAAGRLLIHHQNPYDAAAVLQLERSVGFTASNPLVMRNPPWALFLVLPLGLFSAPVAGVVWMLVVVTCLVVSVNLLWSMYGDGSPLPLVFYAFAPIFACVTAGQTSAILLLGMTGFLKFHKADSLLRQSLAGACLVLVAAKPHLLLPFFAVMLFWMLTRKRASAIFLGGAAGLSVAVVLAISLDRHILSDYLPVLMRGGEAITPNASALLRVAHPQAAWLQYVLTLCACIFAVWYFFKHRAEWDWQRHGPLLLVLSIWAAPYCWLSDEVLVLPAIMSIRQRVPYYVLNAAIFLPIVLNLDFRTWAYAWTATAWLGWYLLALRTTRNTQESRTTTAAVLSRTA